MSQKDTPVLPEELVQEAKASAGEDMLFQWLEGGSGEDNATVNVADNWIRQSIDANTILQAKQVVPLAILPHIPAMYPEVPELKGFPLYDIIQDYKLLLTAIEGTARTDHKDVIMSMFGAKNQQEELSTIQQFITGHNNEDSD